MSAPLTGLYEAAAPARAARVVKNALRLADRRRLESGEVTIEQLSREVSIVDPKAKAGRILFSTRGRASLSFQ